MSKSRAQLDQEIVDAFASRSDLSPREIRKLLDPFRGFRRQARFDVFDADGRWLGDTWAYNVRDAVGIGGGVAYAIEHAKNPSKVTLEELRAALRHRPGRVA